MVIIRVEVGGKFKFQNVNTGYMMISVTPLLANKRMTSDLAG